MSRRFLASLGSFLVTVGLVLACGKTIKQAPGLEVVVSARGLEAPGDYDTVGFQVSQRQNGQFGQPLLDQHHSVPDELTLPTVVSISTGSSADQLARVTVTAYKQSQAVVVRTAQLQLPSDRIAILSVVLAANCLNVSCPDGQSCRPETGKCDSDVVDTTTLPSYTPGSGDPGDHVDDGGSGDGTLPPIDNDGGSGFPDAVGPPPNCGQGGQQCCTGAGQAPCFNGSCASQIDSGGCFCAPPNTACGAGPGAKGICVNGMCQGGGADGSTGVCSPGQFQCTGPSSYQQCDPDGTSWKAGDCGSGMQCVNSSCQPVAVSCGQIGQDCCAGGSCGGGLSTCDPPTNKCVTCGNPGELCCQGTHCMPSGGGQVSCGVDGKCTSCGVVGQACCPGNSCNNGNCMSGTCAACGDTGQPCCGGGGCNNGGQCASGTCSAPCGQNGQPCCPFNQCNGTGGACCVQGTCVGQGGTCGTLGGFCGNGSCNNGNCGGGGQVCCAGNTCTSGNNYCSGNQCMGCGHPGMSCCPGSLCMDPNVVCAGNNQCKPCGGLNSPCCGASSSTGPCQSGLTCNANQCTLGGCVPKTCADLGATCGAVSDGCGGTTNCGSCGAPQTCGGGGVANQCGGGGTACTPATCAALGANCGPQGDGCGGGLPSCGTCTAPQSCGGGGPSKCGPLGGCTPKTCAQMGVNCGPMGDSCGGFVMCGSCASPQTCGGGGMHSVCGP